MIDPTLTGACHAESKERKQAEYDYGPFYDLFRKIHNSGKTVVYADKKNFLRVINTNSASSDSEIAKIKKKEHLIGVYTKVIDKKDFISDIKAHALEHGWPQDWNEYCKYVMRSEW